MKLRDRLLLSGAVLCYLMLPEGSLAQITPDASLGEERSRVTPNVTVRGAAADRIDGGATRGANLYHSFQDFNVNEGQRVYFGNPAGIQNILSRVTGTDVSDILGTLGVDGSANLFLLNPNGIIFGPNAQLDVSGSFTASTGDRFTFPDGSEFSATNPQAPPLLNVNVTPGLQYGTNAGAIANQGNLSIGQNLTLFGGNLALQGTLQARQNLTLQAQDTLQIRDSVTQPFIATAGNQLLVQGDQTVDIFALNHPNSGLYSGGDMVLRSATPVIGDAHYYSNEDFRIEQLDETLGDLTSPNDPVIRATGDVSFGSYTGASLHIFAGGSVTVPGAIAITGADPANGIVETVTLSDGSTVAINGQTTPTLDIRAGTLAVNPIGVVGDIPGLALGTGATSADITIGSIRNEGGTVFLTNQYQPNLVLSGGNIRVGAIDTSAIGAVNIPNLPLTRLQVRGGDVVIDSRGRIDITEAESVNTSARATVGVPGAVLRGDVDVNATGGAIRLNAQDAIDTENLNSLTSVFAATVGNATPTTTGGNINLQSATSISAGNLNSSADMVTGGLGNYTPTSTGGDITLQGADSISTGDIDSSANGRLEASEGDSLTSTGGDITLQGADSISTGDIDSSANGRSEENGGDSLTSTGGDITLQGADSISTGDIDSSANGRSEASGSNLTLTSTGGDITLQGADSISTGDIDSSANGRLEASGSNLTLTSTGGDITLQGADSISTGNLTSSAAANFEGTFANMNGNATLTSTGGAINLGSADSISVGHLNSSAAADFEGMFANMFGRVMLISTGGAIDLESADSISTDNLNSSASATANAGSSRFTTSITSELFGITLTSSGGEINLDSATSASAGDINSSANATMTSIRRGFLSIVGGNVTLISSGGAINLESADSISAENLNSSANTTADGSRFVSLVDEIALTSSGGAINLESADFVSAENLNSSANTTVDGGTFGSVSISGNVVLTSSGGAINLDSTNFISAENLNSSAAANLVSTFENVLGNISLTSTGGAIDLTSVSGEVSLSDGSSIRSNVFNGDGDGGDIQIRGASIQLINNLLTTTVAGEGDAGDINIHVTENAVISGSSLLTGRESGAAGTGTGGTIDITAGAIELTNFSFLNTATFGRGDAGDVSLATTQGNISLNNSSIFSLTAGQGNPGNISIDSAGALRLEGNSLISTAVALGAEATNNSISGNITVNAANGVEIIGVGVVERSTQVGTNPNVVSTGADTRDAAQAIGDSFALVSAPQDAPNVLFPNEVPFAAISANNNFDCIICDNGQISNSDFYSVEVTAVGTQITLDVDNTSSSFLSPFYTGSLDADLRLYDSAGTLLASNTSAPVSLGAGGSTTPNDAYLTYVFNEPGTYFIEVRSNHITTPPLESYNAQGRYTLNVSRVDDFLVSSGITTQTRSDIPSGNISINTPTMLLRDGAQISASNVSSRSGDIQLQGLSELTMEGGSQILASTDTGSAGNITVDAPNGTIRIQGTGTRLSAETETANRSSNSQAGNVSITASQLEVRDNAEVSISTRSGRGSNVALTIDDLVVSEGLILAQTESGVAGNLTVNTPSNPADSVVLSGVLSDGTPAGLSVEATNEQGRAGELRIYTRDLTVSNGADLSAETIRGNIDNTTDTIRITGLENLTLDNARISASTQRSGFAGGVTIEASESVTLRGQWVDADGNPVRDEQGNPLVDQNGNPLPAGVFVEGRGEGIARSLQIETGRLLIEDGAQASVSTENGQGGDLDITATESVRLRNGAGLFARATGNGIAGSINIDTSLLDLRDGSTISATNVSTGGGGVELRGINRLQVIDSEISTSTETGSAGDIRIRSLDGGRFNLLDSRLASEATNGGTAGSVEIQDVETLNVQDSSVTVSSEEGRAGNLQILNAGTITLDNARLEAIAGEGNNGNINLTISGPILQLSNGSEISAEARNSADGGSITIDVRNGFVLTNYLEDSDIIASASGIGDGGSVQINALAIFGLEERDTDTPYSDIVVSSRFGTSGTIDLNTLGIDPTRGLAELPETVEPPNQVARGCGTDSETTATQQGSFVVTGRGGLPPNPGDVLNSEPIGDDWVALDETDEPQTVSVPPAPGSQPLTEIVEAQGWMINDKGEVEAAVAPSSTPQNAAIATPTCAVANPS